MSEKTSSPVPKRAITAKNSAANANASSSQQDADEVVVLAGHESQHMNTIDSQKIRFQNQALGSSKVINNQNGETKLKFSIQAILHENRESSATGASKIDKPSQIASPDSKLESLMDLNTGQMADAGVQSAVRPQHKPAATAKPNRENAFTEKSRFASSTPNRESAFAEKSGLSQIAPPGFAAAAAAAAVAAADAGAHTATPGVPTAVAERTAVNAGERLAAPWPAAAAAEFITANAGARPATPWSSTVTNNVAAADAGARTATPWPTYATQPYLQPLEGGSNGITQAHHPSMTLHYMPNHGILLPLVHGHGTQPPPMTRMPPPQTQTPPPQSQVPPPPPSQPPPLARHGAAPTIRCVPSDQLMPRSIPGVISDDRTTGQMGHSLPMMPSQDRRQFPAFKAAAAGVQGGGQFLMHNNQGLNMMPISGQPMNVAAHVMPISVPPMNIISQAPPMPTLMPIQQQNVMNTYGGQNVGRQAQAWPAWAPLLPREARSMVTEAFTAPAGLPIPDSARPRSIAPNPRPPPPQLPPSSPMDNRPRGKQRPETLQQNHPLQPRPLNQMMPPPFPPHSLNQMDDRPRGRPRTKGRQQQQQPMMQPQPLVPSQPLQQPPPQAPHLQPQPPPEQQPQEVSRGGLPQSSSNVGEMTSRLTAMKSISRAMKQFGPKKKLNRKKASNNNCDNAEHDFAESQPDVDHISTGGGDQEENDDQVCNDNDVTDENQMALQNFKAQRLSSLQLKTAKAMLDKERKELQRKKIIDMFSDARTTITPYIDHYEEHNTFTPLYLAAYIINTPGCLEAFICNSCKKEVEQRQSFRKHNQTKTHLKNLKNWCKVIENNNFEDFISNIKRKISKAEIKSTRDAIATHEEFHNMARARFFVQCKDQLIAQDVHEDETEVEVVDLTQQVNEQQFIAYDKARKAIKNLCPGQFPDFKKQATTMISMMYFDKEKCTGNLQLQLILAFYDKKKPKKHWISKMYENIKRRVDSRKFMQRQLEQENLSFAHKSAEQLEEVKAICGLARLLFPICVDCPFVPNSYVILLAVLMDTNDRILCDATSTRLENGWVIDLLLKSGIAILNPTTGIRPVVATEPEIEQNQEEVVISEQAEPSYHIHLPDSVWSNERLDPSHVQVTTEEAFTSEIAPQTFLSSAGLNIESDLLLNQTRIQDDIKINNTEVTAETEEAAKTDWTLDPETYQTSHSSYSSSSSIQSIAGEDTNDNIIEEHDYYLEEEEAMDQETEVSRVAEDNSAIICIPNLPKYVTVNSLKDLFRPYGPMIDIQIEYSDNAKFKNGIITFLERSNAVSAMISMNNTIYRHKKFNIVMAEKKIKLLREYQNRLEDSPLENLASLVQTMTGQWESSGLEVDPETEMSQPHPEEKRGKNSKQRSKNRSTKKNCKRKIKSNLQEDTTKSSKPDVGEASNEEQSEICLEISIGSDEEQVEEVGEIHNDFELQCSVSSHPPDPIYLANCLFAHWEENLNFYEDVKRTNNGAFANETINHLAILIDDASARCQKK